MEKDKQTALSIPDTNIEVNEIQDTESNIKIFRKFTMKQKAFIMAYNKSFGNITKSCKAAKVFRSRYYQWRKEDLVFAEFMDNLYPEEEFLDLVESKLQEGIKGGDASLIRFALRTKGKDRGYTDNKELVVDNDSNIHFYIPHNGRNTLPETIDTEYEDVQKIQQGIDDKKDEKQT